MNQSSKDKVVVGLMALESVVHSIWKLGHLFICLGFWGLIIFSLIKLISVITD